MTFRNPYFRVLVLAVCAGVVGCTWMTDPDGIVVARVNGENITRGDLARHLRSMPDDERPIIQNKGDLQAVLRRYIDNKIRQDLGQKLLEEGKIDIKREEVAQVYDQMHPEVLRMTQIPPERLKEYDLSEFDIQAMKEEREIGIDKLYEQAIGESAVGFRARQALTAGTLVVSDAELKEEYDMQKDQLNSFEKVEFLGIAFMGLPDAQARAEAAKVKARVDAGEPFEQIADVYRAVDPNSVMQISMENNPNDKFRGFWQQVSGAQPGQVLGPVFMPPSERVAPTGGVEQMPGFYLVLKVLQHAPAQSLTVEEARPMLLPPILIAKMMKKLYEEYEVEIYDDKLPDPATATGTGLT